MPACWSSWPDATQCLEVMPGRMLQFFWRWMLVHLVPVARLLAGLGGRLKYHLQAGRRRNLLANLSAAFPTKPPGEIREICRRVFITDERNRVEQHRLELMSESQLQRCLAGIELRGREHLERAYEEGRPVILVT